VFKTSSKLELVASMNFVSHLGQQVSPTKNDSITQGTSQEDATTLFHPRNSMQSWQILSIDRRNIIKMMRWMRRKT
jgi:hypothetical protein